MEGFEDFIIELKKLYNYTRKRFIIGQFYTFVIKIRNWNNYIYVH